MMRGNKNRSHVLLGIQSLVLVLQLCVFVRLQNQQDAAILVESWSPKALPFSVTKHNKHPVIAFQDWRGRRTPNNIMQLSQSPFPSGRPSVSILSAASTDGDDGEEESDDEPEFIQVESLTASQVTELIELSFFQACYALSKGDIEPLKLFVVAVTTASKKYKGASAMAIAMTVDSLPASVRPLEPQERDLRETWIKAVYLMMQHVLDGFDGSSNKNDNDDEVANTYGPILVDLVAIHRTGMGLNVNKFVESRKDILLPKDNILVLEDGPEDDDLVRLAVVTQTINVLFTTLVVMAGEDDDDDDESSDDSSEPLAKEEESPSSSKPSSSSTSVEKKKGKKTGSGGKGFGLKKTL